MVSREEAIELAVKYLGEHLRGQFEVTKELPENI
jgi:hypothetical protein